MIKKIVTIEMQYGSDYQYDFHHKVLMSFINAFSISMFSETDYTMFRHKDNKMTILDEDVKEEKLLYIPNPKPGKLYQLKNKYSGKKL